MSRIPETTRNDRVEAMDVKTFLMELSRSTGVSGYEQPVADVVRRAFAPHVDEIREDALGNVIMLKRGSGDGAPKVMLAAHMDEIGLVVTKVEEDGFIRFSSIGGVDQRILPAAEVVVHGKKTLLGVVGAKPPHVQLAGERDKAVKMEDLFIDVGLDGKEAKELVSVGDMITLRQDPIDMNGKLAGKIMDDRSGVAALYACCQTLKKLHHTADVYFVATVQEEVGVRGATVSTFGILPDVGIAVDVGHGDMAGVSGGTLKLGGGPGIGLGPHVHPKLFDKLKDVADRWKIEYSIEPSPYPGGTDAYAIQVVQAGVPTALISIPLRYMHTPVEMLDLADVETAGRLMALFISEMDVEFVEGLRCY